MYRLPDLQPWCGQQCWLSPAGAAEFLSLCMDDNAQCSQWERLLQWEPGLVLWAAAGLQWRLDEPPSLEELASWLPSNAAANVPPEHDSKQPDQITSDFQAQHARLTGGAVAVARAAATLADSEAAGKRGAVPAMARHLAGDESAPPWLRACFSLARLPQQLEAEAQKALGLKRSGGSRKLDAAAILRQARRDVGQRYLAIERRLPLGRVVAAIGRNQRLEARFAAQLQEEKLAALKELAYGASHEINNPLANITMRAQALLRDEVDPQRRSKLEAIVTEGYRAHEMISDMMLFAKPPTLSLAEVDLVELTRQTIDEAQTTPECVDARWSFTAAEEQIVILGDRQHLGATLRALFRNALEATQGSGNINVLLTVDGPWAMVQVQDDGPGLTPRERKHLFDPFFSGREAGRGLGLGLAKAWTVLQQHQGRLELLDAQPTRFQMSLPRSRNHTP